MKTLEEMLKEAGFNYDTIFKINADEALISKDGAVIAYEHNHKSNSLHLVKTNHDHTAFTILSSFDIPEHYDSIEFTRQDPNSDLVFINVYSKDENDNLVPIYSFIYHILLRKSFYEGIFSEILHSREKLLKEKCMCREEDNLVDESISINRSGCTIVKLRINSDLKFAPFFSYGDAESYKKGLEFAELHNMYYSIESSYYAVMDELGQITHVFSNFDQVLNYITFTFNTQNNRKLSYLIGRKVEMGIGNSSKALKEVKAMIEERNSVPYQHMSNEVLKYVKAYKGEQ